MKQFLATEKILKHRVVDGRNQYLVKWAGYPKNKATWQPEENILDRRLIDVFNQSQHSSLSLSKFTFCCCCYYRIQDCFSEKFVVEGFQ